MIPYSCSTTSDCVSDGHGLGPSMGWVGLNEKYCYSFHCILCLLQYNVLRIFANSASNANAVYRQTDGVGHAIVVLQNKAGRVLGLKFGVRWVGVFTATLNVSIPCIVPRYTHYPAIKFDIREFFPKKSQNRSAVDTLHKRPLADRQNCVAYHAVGIGLKNKNAITFYGC